MEFSLLTSREIKDFLELYGIRPTKDRYGQAQELFTEILIRDGKNGQFTEPVVDLYIASQLDLNMPTGYNVNQLSSPEVIELARSFSLPAEDTPEIRERIARILRFLRGRYLINIGRIAQGYGFVPIPVFGKIPRFRNWPNVRVDPNDPEKTLRRIGHLYTAKTGNNVGIVTGEASGVVVVDVETSDIPWWDELVRKNGGLPETFTVETGTGGRHIYFKYEPPIDRLGNLNKILGQNIDFRTNGGVIVFPGSIDPRTGGMYKVLSGYENDRPVIASMPMWLFNMLLFDQKQKK